MAKFFTKDYWSEKFATLKDGASEKLDELKKTFSEKWDAVKQWYNTHVAPKLTKSYWKEKFSGISKGLSDRWDAVKNWWDNNKPSLASVKVTIESIKEKMSTAWNTAKEWWNSKPALQNISVTVGSILDQIQGAWRTAKAWISQQALKLNIKLPHFSFGWNFDIGKTTGDVAEVLFGKRAIPWIDVEWYAQGGFPGQGGDLFVANEAGPELVGKIGNRNAVVNNDQIVEAVSRGVYGAVVEAMSGYAGDQSGQEIRVYLDGKQITASVEKHQKQRGATLMTGGTVYGY